MRYVITGGAGQISRPLAEKLLAAGHQVTVISRDAAHLLPLTEKGARAAIGTVEDVGFLGRTFAGADAVYTMVPPTIDPGTDMKEAIGRVGGNYAEAIRANNIKHVVNLSSVGAHLREGCGPVSGLCRVEQSLNELGHAAVRQLRPVYFYSNFLANLGMVKNMNMLGSNFGGPGFTMPLAAPGDVAETAFEELNGLAFAGHSARYIASDERTTDEIAAVIGSALGKPELRWAVFSDEQSLGGLKAAGFPEVIGREFVEMGRAMRTGIMLEDYWKNRPGSFGRTKLEDFAKVFSMAYNMA